MYERTTRHQLLKPLLMCTAVFVLVAFAFDPTVQTFLFRTLHSASAVGDYSATDLLGQLSPLYDNNGTPVYTTNWTNNHEEGVNPRGLSSNADVELDSVHHRLFVADGFNNRVLVFNLDTNNQLVDHGADFVLGQSKLDAPPPGTNIASLSSPLGLAYDSTGNRLFVSDFTNNRVMVFDVSTITDGQNAINVLGQTDFVTATAGTTQSKLSGPDNLAYDATNSRLFVSDTVNYRVMVFNVASIINGQNAVNVLGQTDYVTGTGSLSQSTFMSTYGLAYDATNSRLFVSDDSVCRVMVFNVATITNGQPAVNVLGQTDFVTGAPGCGTTQSKLFSARGLYFSSAENRLFVSDYTNNRVMVFSVASITNGQPAVDVIGQTDFVTGTAGTTQSTLSGPDGVAYDATANRLYVSDFSNNRIMMFTIAPPAASAPAAGGRRHDPPAEIGFIPDRIVINDDQTSTDTKNVLISVYAHYSSDFTGTVDVLLSNTPDFAATIPFRYAISASGTNTTWPKTIAWDLCFGLPAAAPCDPGKKVVYARFYVNVPNVWPALTPLGPPSHNSP